MLNAEDSTASRVRLKSRLRLSRYLASTWPSRSPANPETATRPSMAAVSRSMVGGRAGAADLPERTRGCCPGRSRCRAAQALPSFFAEVVDTSYSRYAVPGTLGFVKPAREDNRELPRHPLDGSINAAPPRTGGSRRCARSAGTAPRAWMTSRHAAPPAGDHRHFWRSARALSRRGREGGPVHPRHLARLGRLGHRLRRRRRRCHPADPRPDPQLPAVGAARPEIARLSSAWWTATTPTTRSPGWTTGSADGSRSCAPTASWPPGRTFWGHGLVGYPGRHRSVDPGRHESSATDVADDLYDPPDALSITRTATTLEGHR